MGFCRQSLLNEPLWLFCSFFYLFFFIEKSFLSLCEITSRTFPSVLHDSLSLERISFRGSKAAISIRRRTKASHRSCSDCSTSPDGVGVGQRRSHRNDDGQVHDAAGGRAAGLVPQHGRRRDVAGQRVPQEGPEVCGSNPRPPGRVSAVAPEVPGTNPFFFFLSSFELKK